MLRNSPLRNRSGWAPSRQELALIGVTMIWGVTFLIVHAAMRASGPLFFVGLRFAVAGVLGLALFARTLRGVTRREIAAGCAVGATIFLGYALQTDGLKTVSSSLSAFITALYVPIVPVLQWLALRRRPHLMSWVGVTLAFVGLALLARPDAGSIDFGWGEAVTLIGAVATAGEIVLIGRFASQVDSRRVTTVQLLAASALSFAAMPLTGEQIPAFSWVWLTAAAGLGVASALIQLTMNWAQKDVSPTKATLIYAGEPVWGGVAGGIAGDRLPPLALLGAAFVVAGVIASEWRPRRAARAAGDDLKIDPHAHALLPRAP